MQKMKTSKNPILPSCLLLFAFACICIFNFSVAADPVLDTGGQALHSGVNYYVVSAGSGLKPAKGENNTCPFQVVQALAAGDMGLPLRISPVNSTGGAVQENADVTVEFVASNLASGCPQSRVWLVQNLFVTTGGDGKGSGASLFTIVKYEDGYAFQFCPRAAGCSVVCPRLQCGYIGVEMVDGARRLAFNRPPLKIVFQKA
ncbi:PREDICTED: kunitz trypsin inhibitor 2-like [Ipomoea nil]|uniref:kunitz trypsin inhibitor 2-like n=1 Tax=Ipomoea nil TaxID=35883 RepID=UPI0009009BFD|nr:PREDICTED: kunitz trypsin inhibitor 2-like [Ipomoea nil]